MSRPAAILFVCIGNACRSQMAEGLARHYGREQFLIASAGLMPLHAVPLLTRRVMAERNMPIEDQYPKGVELYRRQSFDRIINMSGMPLPSGLLGPVEEWVVTDPYGRSEDSYRQVRDHLEPRVKRLLEEFQGPRSGPPERRPGRIKLRGL